MHLLVKNSVAHFATTIKNTRKFKGVSQTANGKWRAWRRVGDVVHIAGIYDNDVEAARASDKLAKELWFSGRLNFPKGRVKTSISEPDSPPDLTPKQLAPRPKELFLFAYSGVMIETDILKLEAEVDNIFEKSNSSNPDKGISGRLTFFPVHVKEDDADPTEGHRVQIGDKWESKIGNADTTYFRDPEGAATWKGKYGCYQILEGSQNHVEELYDKVQNDKRVGDLVVHYGRIVGPASSFPDWGMQVEVTNSILDWSEERLTLRFM